MGEQISEFTRAHRKPIAISVISSLLTFAGTFGAMQQRQSNLEKRMDEEHAALVHHLDNSVDRRDFVRFQTEMRADQRAGLNEYVTRAEFTQFTSQLNTRLDDMRELLIQIKRQ